MRNPLYAVLQVLYRAIGGHGLGRVKFLRFVYDGLFSLLKPKSVMVLGHRMWLDERDALELGIHGVYEPTETELLQRELKPGQTFVDVGANIGYYTLIAARLVGHNGRVLAFEPDPQNFALLKKNVEQNGCSNVTLVNKAVSNKTRTQKLYLSGTNPGDHQLFDSKDGRKSITIKSVALDDWFKPLDKKVDLIKMDIQGAEAGVLAGMKGLMKKNPKLKLITEFWPYGLSQAGHSPSGYLKALQKLGFKLWEISEKKKTIKPSNIGEILKRCTPENRDYTNFFCKRT